MIKMLILSLNLLASEKNIDCGFNQCIPDSSYSSYLEQSNQTYIDLGPSNNSDVNVKLLENADPRNLNLIIENTDNYNHNVIIDFKSKKKEKDSPNIILVGSVFNNITINTDGFDGESGEDASIICGRRFLDGSYGEIAKTYYQNRRSNSQLIPADRCTQEDLEFLHNTKFTCDDPTYNTSEFPRVAVSRNRYKQKCNGTTIRNKCLQKTVSFTCEWAARGKGYRKVNKYNNYQCPNPWISSGNCVYIYESCWHTLLHNSWQQEENSYPKWKLLQNIGRCNRRYVGGEFAYQETKTYPELLFKEIGNMKTICENNFPYPQTSVWYFMQATNPELTSPGLNPDTLEPIVIPDNEEQSSTWIVNTSDFFQSCDANYEKIQTITEGWSTFGELGKNCSDATHPSDPNNRIPWVASGIEQNSSFGQETLFCDPNDCPVKVNSNDLDKSFDLIDPTVGANSTSQGSGLVFIFRTNHISTSFVSGIPGIGGKNDLEEITTKKYCVKIDDASTRGVDSDYGNTPLVNFKIYNWKGIDINTGQPGGSSGYNEDKKILVFKGLNKFVRNLISQDLMIQ